MLCGPFGALLVLLHLALPGSFFCRSVVLTLTSFFPWHPPLCLSSQNRLNQID